MLKVLPVALEEESFVMQMRFCTEFLVMQVSLGELCAAVQPAEVPGLVTCGNSVGTHASYVTCCSRVRVLSVSLCPCTSIYPL